MDRDRLDQVRIAMMVINAAKEKPETVTEVMALVFAMYFFMDCRKECNAKK